MPAAHWTPDQHDAWTIANHLREAADLDGRLSHYLHPDLSAAESSLAAIEGGFWGLLSSVPHPARNRPDVHPLADAVDATTDRQPAPVSEQPGLNSTRVPF
jgi:ABC-type branched-subunit amino acid transport system substrate-binding protein